MKKLLFMLSLSFLFFATVKAQMNDNELRQQVLKQSKMDSMFVFGKWTAEGSEETRLTYLGHVTTNKGKTYKIMTSAWIFGPNKRSTNRILIYNYKNRYVGNYYLTSVEELPTKLENGVLIFANRDKDCDKKLTTRVSLKKGLPARFFRRCKGTFGSFYMFESD